MITLFNKDLAARLLRLSDDLRSSVLLDSGGNPRCIELSFADGMDLAQELIRAGDAIIGEIDD